MDFRCERAWVDGAIHDDVLIRTVDGVITEVGPVAEPDSARAEAASTATRLSGVVFPGFANAHSHAFHRALRGRTHADGGSFWTWREAMYRLADGLDPDTYHRLAVAVYTEMLTAGYTGVGEFHYAHHPPTGRYDDPNAMGLALLAAAREVEIHLTLLDTLYLHGGLTETGYQPLSGPAGRFDDGSVEHWWNRVSRLSGEPGTLIGAAAHSVRAVDPRSLTEFAEVTSSLPRHVHLSEQPAENEACLRWHHRTPTGLLDDCGLLGPNTTAVHATHLTDADIARLGQTRTGVCLCPSTEADLADGIGPARELVDAGAWLSLGSDQHVAVDPFVEARGIEFGERLRTGHRGRFTPAELIDIATVNGHTSIGRHAGRLAVGCPGDLVAINADTARTAGSAPEQLLFAASASDVDTVVVGGRIMVRQGRHERLGDPGPLLASAIAELWRRAGEGRG